MSATETKKSSALTSGDLKAIAASQRAVSKSIARIESDMTNSAAALDHLANSLVERLPSIDEALSSLEARLDKIEKRLDLLPSFEVLQTLATQLVAVTDRMNKYVDSSAEGDGRIRARLSKLEENAQR